MKKSNVDLADVIFGVFASILGLTVACGAIEAIQTHNLSKKHKNFQPMKSVLQYEDSMCYAIGDSVLDARKARYDELINDYNFAIEEVYNRYRGLFSVHQKFDKIYVKPKYAKQIGVNNIRQYSKYLDNYERDSLAPAYANAYKNKVVPMTRNGTRSK